MVLVLFQLECLVIICQLNSTQHSSSSKIINSNRSNSSVSNWIMVCILTWWHQYSIILEPFNSGWNSQTLGNIYWIFFQDFFFKFCLTLPVVFIIFSKVWRRNKIRLFKHVKIEKKTVLTINNYHDFFFLNHSTAKTAGGWKFKFGRKTALRSFWVFWRKFVLMWFSYKHLELHVRSM